MSNTTLESLGILVDYDNELFDVYQLLKGYDTDHVGRLVRNFSTPDFLYSYNPSEKSIILTKKGLMKLALSSDKFPQLQELIVSGWSVSKRPGPKTKVTSHTTLMALRDLERKQRRVTEITQQEFRDVVDEPFDLSTDQELKLRKELLNCMFTLFKCETSVPNLTTILNLLIYGRKATVDNVSFKKKEIMQGILEYNDSKYITKVKEQFWKDIVKQYREVATDLIIGGELTKKQYEIIHHILSGTNVQCRLPSHIDNIRINRLLPCYNTVRIFSRD